MASAAPDDAGGRRAGRPRLPAAIGRAALSPWDVVDAARMTIACVISYWVMTHVLVDLVSRDSDLLGGMWAVIATIFVFRDTRSGTLSAGASRLIGTGISFALCLAYLWVLPFTIAGLGGLLFLGSVIVILLGRRDEFMTTAITTTVVMVVATISPHDAWQQPLLRLLDTLVGVGVGVAARLITTFPNGRAR
jgi:uncharacterized membrane protein YccC